MKYICPDMNTPFLPEYTLFQFSPGINYFFENETKKWSSMHLFGPASKKILLTWFQSQRWRYFFRSKMWGFTPPPLKWLNLPFKIYLLLYWCYQPKLFLARQKYICFEKQKCFWCETKNDKNIWIWKFKNPPKWPFPQTLFFTTKNCFLQKKKDLVLKNRVLGKGHLRDIQIFKFSNSNFFVIFCFPSKKNVFSQSKHTFVLPK